MESKRTRISMFGIGDELGKMDIQVNGRFLKGRNLWISVQIRQAAVSIPSNIVLKV